MTWIGWPAGVAVAVHNLGLLRPDKCEEDTDRSANLIMKVGINMLK